MTIPRYVVVLLAAVAVGLLRGRPPGALNSLWAEDGQEFLTDALTLPWYEPLATPFNGYFHTVARVCFAVIALFPVSWAAALNAVTAAVLTALLAFAVAAAARDRLGTAAALVIGGSAAVPMGYVPNALAQLQFPLVYAGLWMLLWTPRRRAARVVAVAVPALAVLNSVLGLLLVPVALLRLARHRDRDALLRVLALLPGAALQLVPLLLGGSRRDVGERPDLDPVSVAAAYLRWGVPRSFLGDVWLAPPVADPAAHQVLVLLGLAIPVALVVAGLLRRTRPQWRLAAVLAGFGAFAGAFQLAVHGAPEGRYLVLITLPNIAAAVALALPAGVPAALSAAGSLVGASGGTPAGPLVGAVDDSPAGPLVGAVDGTPAAAAEGVLVGAGGSRAAEGVLAGAGSRAAEGVLVGAGSRAAEGVLVGGAGGSPADAGGVLVGAGVGTPAAAAAGSAPGDPVGGAVGDPVGVGAGGRTPAAADAPSAVRTPVGAAAGWGGAVPFVALATLVTVVAVANLRPGGYTEGLPRWDTTVAAARAQCQAEPRLRRVTVHTAQWPVLGWEAVLPCDRLR